MTDKLKIVFSPGSFDDFDGTQEELDQLVGEIMEYLQSSEFLEKLEEAREGLDEDEYFNESDFSDMFGTIPGRTIH